MFKIKQALKLRPCFYSFFTKVRFNLASVRDERHIPDEILNNPSSTLGTQEEESSQIEDDKLISHRFRMVAEAIESTNKRKTFMYERIMMEFQEIFKASDQIINNKENVFQLMNLLVKLNVESNKTHFQKVKKRGVECFKLYDESPDNSLLFSKTWERVIAKANLTLQDQNLLFETLYNLPRTLSDKEMLIYVENYLTSNLDKMPVSQALFLFDKIQARNKKSGTSKGLLNSIIKKYPDIKDNLFDLATLNSVYYKSLSSYFGSIENLNKYNMAQNITSTVESKFQEAENVDVSPAIGDHHAKKTLFYQQILKDAFDYIDKFEKGEIDITEKEFIQGLLFLFKSTSRFSIQSQRLCETMDKYALKYQNHLSLNDKFALIMFYSKSLNIVPAFAPAFENEILKALRELLLTLTYKERTTLYKSSMEHVFSNEQHYMHLKKDLKSDENREETSLFLETESEAFVLGAQQLHDIYWYLGKTYTPMQSEELVKISNDLYNLCIELYTRNQLCDGLQAACTLSLRHHEGIDWENDIKLKLQVIGEKLKSRDPSKSREPLQASVVTFYKNLTFIESKFGINPLEYFTGEQLEYFRQIWFGSQKIPKPSNVENKIYDILTRYFKRNGISRVIHRTKIVDLFKVNMLIEPDIAIEIRAKISTPRNSSMEIIKNASFGNMMIKQALFAMRGYKPVELNFVEFEYLLDDLDKLEAYIVEKVKPYL